jgi:hypothetical protein
VVAQETIKKHYEGDSQFIAGEYDHIFDVEIGTGEVKKLPFNKNSDYQEAASKFCLRENLPLKHAPLIIHHLKANSKQKEPLRNYPKCVPLKTHLLFDQLNVLGPKNKIIEFNNGIIKNIEHLETLCLLL